MLSAGSRRFAPSRAADAVGQRAGAREGENKQRAEP